MKRDLRAILADIPRPVQPCPFCGDKIVRFDAPEFVPRCGKCERVLPVVEQSEAAS